MAPFLGISAVISSVYSLKHVFNAKAYNVGCSSKAAYIYGFAESMGTMYFTYMFSDGLSSNMDRVITQDSFSEKNIMLIGLSCVAVSFIAAKVAATALATRFAKFCGHPITTEQARRLTFWSCVDLALFTYLIYSNLPKDFSILDPSTYLPPRNSTASELDFEGLQTVNDQGEVVFNDPLLQNLTLVIPAHQPARELKLI